MARNRSVSIRESARVRERLKQLSASRSKSRRDFPNDAIGESESAYQIGQPFTKKFGCKGSQVPSGQQLRIQRMYMQGMSIRRIAEEEDRARQTVAKIVRAPEMQNYLEKLRATIVGLGDDAVNSIRFALRHETDGRIAYSLLKDLGAIQTGTADQMDGGIASTERRIELLKVEWTKKLELIALERHQVYGTELPESLKLLA
jgi:hypothetical protein